MNRIWDLGNLTAWEIVPWDSRRRTPHERAAMLARLGIRGEAYDWREEHIPEFEEEFAALARHGVRLDAWWFPTRADDPMAASTVELFHRRGVAPELWVTGEFDASAIGPLPDGMPSTNEEHEALSAEEQERLHREIWAMVAPAYGATFRSTPEAHVAQVRVEADRIRAIVELGRTAGCTVQLYGHNGWFGMTDNQVEVIEALAAEGVRDVGIVYNFHHARDGFHDDTVDFAPLWERMRSYVTTVNLNGTAAEGEPLLHPSQGDRELEMMRIIEDSGWRGRVGVTAEIGGDIELTLRDALEGIAWCAAELAEPGSAGPRPVLASGGGRS
jgi:hypothetical protein